MLKRNFKIIMGIIVISIIAIGIIVYNTWSKPRKTGEKFLKEAYLFKDIKNDDVHQLRITYPNIEISKNIEKYAAKNEIKQYIDSKTMFIQNCKWLKPNVVSIKPINISLEEHIKEKDKIVFNYVGKALISYNDKNEEEEIYGQVAVIKQPDGIYKVSNIDVDDLYFSLHNFIDK